jgi:hypothetical protein
MNLKKAILGEKLQEQLSAALMSKVSSPHQPAWKSYLTSLTSLTPSTTTPWPVTSPANSQHTKQFLSRPHGL